MAYWTPADTAALAALTAEVPRRGSASQWCRDAGRRLTPPRTGLAVERQLVVCGLKVPTKAMPPPPPPRPVKPARSRRVLVRKRRVRTDQERVTLHCLAGRRAHYYIGERCGACGVKR